MCPAGFSAAKCSHVKYFPNRHACDDYYGIMHDISQIGVDTFTILVQELLLDYLRAKYGDLFAYWCREVWTGECGRISFAHSQYAGWNNNMGVEVSWDIKGTRSPGCSLAHFIGAQCKFIWIVLVEIHMHWYYYATLT